MAPPSNEFLKSEVARLEAENGELRSRIEISEKTTVGPDHVHSGLLPDGNSMKNLMAENAALKNEVASLKSTVDSLNGALNHLRSSAKVEISEGQNMANIMKTGGGSQ